MGSADGFVRDGLHQKAAVNAENTVGNDSLESALRKR
jgi:hypothetical protein